MDLVRNRADVKDLLGGIFVRYKKCRLRCPLFRLFRRTEKAASDEIEEDGGVRDNTNYDAPKTIGSTQIVSFNCWFSTLDANGWDEIGNHIYQLWANLENGAVKGTYHVLDTGEKRVFRADHSFMNTLQCIVNKYDIVRYNGMSYKVEGLPGDYGIHLNVRYASGESIYAYNNQDNFLTEEAIQELVKLFNRGVQFL